MWPWKIIFRQHFSKSWNLLKKKKIRAILSEINFHFPIKSDVAFLSHNSLIIWIRNSNQISILTIFFKIAFKNIYWSYLKSGIILNFWFHTDFFKDSSENFFRISRKEKKTRLKDFGISSFISFKITKNIPKTIICTFRRIYIFFFFLIQNHKLGLFSTLKA